jgi:signal transduction histidine kinase
MFNYIRSRIAWKLFFSYLSATLIGLLVLTLAADLLVPAIFSRHMGVNVSGMMGGMMADIYSSFRVIFGQALLLGLLSALVIVLVISLLLSRKIVAPLRRLTRASQRIAQGHYRERVALPTDVRPEYMDEVGHLAISFNQMAEGLEKNEAIRSQLIGDVSHELRTPLSAIKGYMEALIDGMLPAEPATFQQIYREADRLQRLVEDLQEVSRVEAGAYKLKLRTTSMNAIVDTAVARLRREFDQKGITIAVRYADNLPLIQGDEDRLVQVVLNLLGNALQFTQRGGKVQVSVEEKDHSIFTSISDNGIGMPEGELDRIFTRFYRVEKSRSRSGGGSGIGLTIARHLAEAHGGKIWAFSDGVGTGSTFTIMLPVQEQSFEA